MDSLQDGINVFYRLAPRPAAEARPKLLHATKEACLLNYLAIFPKDSVYIFGDCLSNDLQEIVNRLGLPLNEINEGSGGGNFRAAAKAAMDLTDDAVIYLLEDDFLHRLGAREAILDGLNLGADYVTLYDHPDKYLNVEKGGNPHVKDGGEKTRLLCGSVCHWKITNSTVMTFATTVRCLKRDWKIFLKHCDGRYTDDYRLFRALSWRGRKLISSVPGFATHAETRWLSPLFDWGSYR